MPAELEKSLEAALRAFHDGMASGKEKQQLEALEKMLPQKGDIEILFPQQADQVWNLLHRATEGMKAKVKRHGAEAAKEAARQGRILGVEAIDVRKDDVSGRFQRAVKMIPREIPVYRVVKRYENGSGGSSTYLWVRGRWIWIAGFEEIPNLLSKSK